MRNGSYYFATYEQDFHRGEVQRHAHDRALRAVRLERPSWAERPSLAARLRTAILNLVRRDHVLAEDPSRLPDGRTGRVEAIARR